MRDTTLVNPGDKAALDQAVLDRPGSQAIQLALFLDYATNPPQHPRRQEYLRTRQPPLPAVRGRHDEIFGPDGAPAFTRDAKNARVQLLDSGHFALETRGTQIAALVRDFLRRLPDWSRQAWQGDRIRRYPGFPGACGGASGAGVEGLPTGQVRLPSGNGDETRPPPPCSRRFCEWAMPLRRFRQRR
ncbi:alpha/beta fold hydrolase [Nonomuraea composti]|uniref:alpha/beta fold hydrolase n=1 Tax=Nonomuraea composti TaxID=2720023 RepID=UPI00198227A1|nr:hypothetical protein [Nonomuraea sp. FMUSA5-5]